MISHGKLEKILCLVLITTNFLVVMNYWIINSQNNIPELQPCHRKDCCFLSESTKEPQKIVEVKIETKAKEQIKQTGNLFLEMNKNHSTNSHPKF